MAEQGQEIEPTVPAASGGGTWAFSRASRTEEEGDMDMTPMVDVTFLLLIFFMITAAFALQKAIAIPPTDNDKSASASVDELEDDSIVVRVDGDNVYWVYCPAWPEEERAVSKQDMRNLVRAARQGAPPEGGSSSGTGFTKLLVQASGDATHEYVVSALDAGSGAGVEEIRLMSIEDEF